MTKITSTIAFVMAIATAFAGSNGSMVALAAVVAWGAALYCFHGVAIDSKGVFHANVAVGGLGLVLSAYFGILMGHPMYALMMAALTNTVAVMRMAHLRRQSVA